ncbi:MAG: NAD-dependent epimerase/dehydratase family protein [Gemmatimonadaceae bacterium]|nr:NAD-dependent epimerase/dehydratase family protein [Gemmatimonadaceae bacterium]
MSVVIVLGAEGFLGRHLVHHVAADPSGPHRVVGVDRHARGGGGSYAVDLRDDAAVGHLLRTERPDVVVNLAGVVEGTDDELSEINVELPGRLMRMMASWPETRDARLLLLGSAAEYGECDVAQDECAPLRPASAYGRSKLRQYERFRAVADAGGQWVALARPFNIVGPGMPRHLALASFAEQIAAAGGNERIRTGNLSAVRDFLDVEDVVTALWHVVRRGRSGEVYNVSSGVGHSMRALVEMLVQLSGRELTIDENTSASAGVPVSVGSSEKLRRETGWAPRIPIATSLRRLLGQG